MWLVVARSLPGPTGLRNGTLSAASRSETLRNGTIQRSACFLNARNRLYSKLRAAWAAVAARFTIIAINITMVDALE